MFSPMVWFDKGMLRVIGCGCEGIASPHTEKDLHDPDPQGPRLRDQTRNEFALCLPRQDPCSPRLQVSEKSDRHEACPPALGSRPSPGSKVDDPCRANGHDVGMVILNLMLWGQVFGRLLLPFCLFCASSFVRRCCCCFSLYISISIPDPASLQPRERTATAGTRHCRWSPRLFAPLANLIAAGDVPGLPTSSWV